MADHDPTAHLTDEERAVMDFDESALTDEEANAINATEAPAAAAPADAVAVPPDGEPAAVPADPAAVAAPEVAPAPAATPAAEPAAAPAPAVDPVAPQQQFLVIPPPADAAEKLAQIATDKAALAEKFDAGEITGSEFQTQLDTLNGDKQKIDMAVNNAELSAQLERNRAQQAWDAQCDTFFKEPAASIYTDAATFAVFNENVKAMAPMPRNRGLSERQLLEKVDALTRAELGLPARAATAAAAPAPAAAPKPAAPPAPKAFAPTLGALPTADVTDTSGGQYAHLDRLAGTDPIAYEAEVAKLSDSARDAYFKAG